MTTLATALPLIEGGQLRGIAVTSRQRNARLPDTQTIREAGFAQLEATEWFGIFLPGNAPEVVVKSLHMAVSQALKSAIVLDGFAKQSLDAFSMSTIDFRQMIAAETARWGELVKASGFQPVD